MFREALVDYPPVLLAREVVDEGHEGAGLPTVVQVRFSVVDGAVELLDVEPVGLGERPGDDRARLEVEGRDAERGPSMGQLDRRGVVEVRVGSEPREEPPNIVDVDAAVVLGECFEVLASALCEPRRARPVPLGRVVDRRGELDEAVEQPLVVARSVEPALLPGVVGGVVSARVVDGDPGPERGDDRVGSGVVGARGAGHGLTRWRGVLRSARRFAGWP